MHPPHRGLAFLLSLGSLPIACGNDMQSVMGGQYPAPGITLGPALTFGWLAGRHVAAQNTA